LPPARAATGEQQEVGDSARTLYGRHLVCCFGVYHWVDGLDTLREFAQQQRGLCSSLQSCCRGEIVHSSPSPSHQIFRFRAVASSKPLVNQLILPLASTDRRKRPKLILTGPSNNLLDPDYLLCSALLCTTPHNSRIILQAGVPFNTMTSKWS
jgi:hypothetical protein